MSRGKRQDVLITDVNSLPLILTIPEAAHLSRLGREAIYNAARRQDFPARQVGRQWRIPRDSFVRWLNQS